MPPDGTLRGQWREALRRFHYVPRTYEPKGPTLPGPSRISEEELMRGYARPFVALRMLEELERFTTERREEGDELSEAERRRVVQFALHLREKGALA